MIADICVSAQNPSFSTHISDNQVNVIAQDGKGYIWFGTSHGLNKFNGSTYMVYYASEGPDALPNDNILDLSFGNDGRMWIGTECSFVYMDDKGFHNYNEETVFNPMNKVLSIDKGTVITNGMAGLMRLSTDSIAVTLSSFAARGASFEDKIIKSSTNELWMVRTSEDSSFVDILDHELSLISSIHLGNGIRVDAATEYLGETILISTSKGTMCFDTKSRTRTDPYPSLNSLISGNRVHFILPYEGQKLIVGIEGEGMWVWSAASSKAVRIIPEQDLSADKYVCFVDKDNNIWLSDRSSDIQFYHHDSFLSHLNPAPATKASDQFSKLYFDTYGGLWTTMGGTIKRIDPQSGKITYSSDDNHQINDILIDKEGNLWAIVGKNVLRSYSISKTGLAPLSSFSLSSDVDYITETPAGMLFPLKYDYGIIGKDDKLTIEKNHPLAYTSSAMTDASSRRSFLFSVSRGVYEYTGEEFILRSNGNMRNIHTVLVGSDGTLWYGTYNLGLVRYDPQSGESTFITTDDGLVDNTIKSILEDTEGNIWFSTPNDISRYDIRSGEITLFHDDKMVEGSSYCRNSAAKGPDGKLYFGSTEGLTVVDTSSPLPSAKKDIPIFIDFISVNSDVIQDNPGYLNLNWKENSLEFRFSSLDFEGGKLRSYYYCMEGYDDGFRRSQTGEALYTNLPPGKYRFIARSVSPNNSSNSSEAIIPIRIHPRIWSTTAARISYAVLTLLLLIAIFRTVSTIKLQKERIGLAEQKEALGRERIDMITNISHELRTPLTLIYGPAMELQKEVSTSHQKALIDHILRNAKRLKELSGQILGQSIYHGDDVLDLRKNDLASVIRSSTDNFSYAALEKGISLNQRLPESFICIFDEEKVRKIMVNLLNNAIKYTPEGGHITVSIANSENHVSISVADDGNGIPEEKRGRLFNRYDRLGAESSQVTGNGIGLNYSRKLAETHHGELSYRPNGKQGSIFSLIIPTTEDGYPQETISGEALMNVTPESYTSESMSREDDMEKEGTIMIVEDNPEVRAFIASILRGKYRTITSADGQEAWDNLKISIPDLVISDVLMPNMGGYELCSLVKNDPDLCSTPLVLLTAKSDAASSIEGLSAGADAYIPKPFDPDYLTASVDSLISNRKRIQNKVLSLTSNTIKESRNTAETGLSKMDKAVLEKVYDILDKNLDNDKFTVEDMAGMMNISYSNLYSKLKTLTGTSPVRFIIAYRMNRAMEFLKEGKYTIGEVGYKVGAPSLSTFSRDFKKFFGVSPSSILEQ